MDLHPAGQLWAVIRTVKKYALKFVLQLAGYSRCAWLTETRRRRWRGGKGSPWGCRGGGSGDVEWRRNSGRRAQAPRMRGRSFRSWAPSMETQRLRHGRTTSASELDDGYLRACSWKGIERVQMEERVLRWKRQ
jgi:hypothetical protein